MPRLLLLVCIMMASWILGACGQAVQYQANQANISVTVQMANAPQANQSQPATLTFHKDNTPVVVQNVVCDTKMVGMTMGSNRPMPSPMAVMSAICYLPWMANGCW